ncbi:MAG: tetratricopeptide repeat protein [bacterium]|nr:tetratricopeptide repeat protein [bacterium]
MPFVPSQKRYRSALLFLAVCLAAGLFGSRLLWGAEDENRLLSRAFQLYRAGDYNKAARMVDKFLEGVSLPEEEEAARFLQGDCYYQKRAGNQALNRQLALNSYQKALQKFPDSVLAPKVTYRMAEIYSRQKRYDKAAYLARKNIERYPQSHWRPWSALLLGKNLLRQGREAEGIAALEALCQKSPDSPAALGARVRLMEYLIHEEKFSAALKQYREIESLGQIVDCAEDLGKVPELLVRLGLPAEARKLLFKLLNLLPEDTRSSRWSVMIGDTYDQEEMPTEALKSYYETRERFSETDGATLALAGILSLRARDASPLAFQKVVGEFDALVASIENPALKGVLLMRKAVMLNRSGHVGESIAAIHELLELDPSRPLRKEVRVLYQQSLSEEVEALERAGKYNEITILAQKSFSHISWGSLDKKTARTIAESHFKAGLFHTAARQLENLLHEFDPKAGDERLMLHLGRAYLETGDGEGSKEVAEELLQRFPESSVQGEALLLMGQAALAKNDDPSAVDYFRLALKAGHLEDEGRVHYLLASAYRRQGQRLAALEAFESAVQAARKVGHVNSDSAWQEGARYGLGDMLYATGREKEALSVYGETLARFPEFDGADWARYRAAQIHLRAQEIQEAKGILTALNGRASDAILNRLVKHCQEEIVWKQAFRDLF